MVQIPGVDVTAAACALLGQARAEAEAGAAALLAARDATAWESRAAGGFHAAADAQRWRALGLAEACTRMADLLRAQTLAPVAGAAERPG